MVVYSPYDWSTQEDPYPVYRALRDEAPVYHNEELDFWALSRHQDVLAAFRDSERYSNRRGVALEQLHQESAAAVTSFLAMDPPRHTKLRALVSKGFTPRRVASLEPEIRALATHYIDGFLEKGRCDFIAEFAGKLPMDVISEMLGVPQADRDMLRGWADLVLHREEGNPDVPPAGIEASARLLQYFAQHVAEHRRSPASTLTDALVAAEIDGERLADSDIMSFLFLMVIAGNETTTKLLANALYWLWKNPDQRKKLDEDPGLIPDWAEETLRYDPSSQLIARTTQCPIEIRGRSIPADARVALLIGSANRDERAFERPDSYDIERNTTNSLGFGQGTHFCLGASLARLEARISLEELWRRIPDYEVVPEGLERVHSSNVRGFSAFPIVFGGRR